MPLPLSKIYTDLDIQRMYRKRPATGRPALFHIHVDAKEALPAALIGRLLEIGFVRDDFLLASDDSSISCNKLSPINHLTWMGNAASVFREIWLAADQALLEHRVCAYLEGELVVLDSVLDAKVPKLLNVDAFDRICPVQTNAEKAASFECPVLANDGTIVGYETRLLPLRAATRPLAPSGEVSAHKAPRDTGARELFRLGEVHLTLRRNGLDPRLLALLVAMGLTEPIIPKLAVDASGAALLDEQHKPIIIEDLPMTLQTATEPALLIAFFDVLLRRILFEIGGVGGDDISQLERASVKYEPAPLYGLYNGRASDGSLRRVFDPSRDAPMVLEAVYDSMHGRMTTETLRSVWGAQTASLGGISIRIDAELLPERPGGFWAQLFRDSAWTKSWSVAQLNRLRLRVSA